MNISSFDPKCYKVGAGQSIPEGLDRHYELGMMSNLITNMVLKNADESEMERAIRYSMVIIDAKKEKLDWKRSKTDEDIENLIKKYLKGENT